MPYTGAVGTVLASVEIPGIDIMPGVTMPLLNLGTGPPYTAEETYQAALLSFEMGYPGVCSYITTTVRKQ